MSATFRDEKELRARRRVLFDGFPLAGNAVELTRYQKALVDEIMETELELASDDSPERRWHKHLVRIYGDAVAHTQLSVYAIRQLARNSGKPPHLSGQGDSLKLALECLDGISEQNVPVLLADVTNVLRNGDVIVCADPDLPTIIECKLSKVKDARFERQGRRGRQLSRMKSIGSFLQKGRGRLFGEEAERITIELQNTARFDHQAVSQIVASAIDHMPTTIVISDHEILCASLLGEKADTSKLQDWAGRSGNRVALGGSLDRLEEPWPDVIPPVLLDLAPEARWEMMEGAVSLLHVVSVNAFVGLESDHVRVLGSVEVPGPFPWGYEVLVGDKVLSLGSNFLLDVVYNHETVASAGARLLEFSAKALPLLTRKNRVRAKIGSVSNYIGKIG